MPNCKYHSAVDRNPHRTLMHVFKVPPSHLNPNLRFGMDLIAVSFVQSADDVKFVRKTLDDAGGQGKGPGERARCSWA
jgi:hypothetical protein